MSNEYKDWMVDRVNDLEYALKVASDALKFYSDRGHYIEWNFPREVLYQRINKRVDVMIENGLIGEVERLIKNGLTPDNQSLQGIGYKEVYSYLNGEISLDDTLDLIKQNTRRYAKRQITFFKKLDRLKWLQPDDTKILAKQIVEEI